MTIDAVRRAPARGPSTIGSRVFALAVCDSVVIATTATLHAYRTSVPGDLMRIPRNCP
jgi:hypothetical protein